MIGSSFKMEMEVDISGSLISHPKTSYAEPGMK
jgi:hypothetical protein